MPLTKKPVKVAIEVTVFTKNQKDAFFDIMTGFFEKPVYLSHTSKFIKYKVVFNFYTNYKGFLFETSGLYPQYKFRYIRTDL